MLTRQIRTQINFTQRVAGCVAAAVLLAVASAQATFFSGEFAPDRWTFSGDTGSELIWNPAPPEVPIIASVYAAPGVASVTSLSLQPVTTATVFKFVTKFYKMSATDASLTMTAPGVGTVSLGEFTDPPGVSHSFTISMQPGDTIVFGMFSDSPSDKKNVSYFTVEAIPEASTWFAAMGLLSLCGVQVWRSYRGTRMATPQAA